MPRIARAIAVGSRTTSNVIYGREDFIPAHSMRSICMLQVRYVENNPVRAGITTSAEDYRWSSARDHVVDEANENIHRESYLFEEIRDWSAYLKNEDKESSDNIRKSTMTGRPCGASGFASEMESLLRRRLHPLAVGRPRLVGK